MHGWRTSASPPRGSRAGETWRTGECGESLQPAAPPPAALARVGRTEEWRAAMSPARLVPERRSPRHVLRLLPLALLLLGLLPPPELCRASPNRPPNPYAPTPAFGYTYDPYAVPAPGAEQPYAFRTPPLYAVPVQPLHAFQARPLPHYFVHSPYPSAAPAPDKDKGERSGGDPLRLRQPYLTKAYDYTRDFLLSLESIKELRDPAIRAAMLALKDLEPVQPGSLFGHKHIKLVAAALRSLQVLSLWKRTNGRWSLFVHTLEVPQGHNPTVGQLGRMFLLNASTAAASGCSRNWFDHRLKIEALYEKAHEGFISMNHQDISVPLRDLKEIRFILEDMVFGSTGTPCFTRTLNNRLGTFMPSSIYENMQPATLKLLILKPTSLERHVSDEAEPYSDGPVAYSFESPYKTSFIQEVQIPNGSNPTLYRFAHLFMRQALHSMQQCSLSSWALVPSFAAIAKDDAGKVHVLPIVDLGTPLRALGWAAREAEMESGKETTVNLVLFLQNILKSEAANPCFESNFKHIVPMEVSEKMHVLPVWVTASCTGLLVKTCKRKLIELHFTNTKTNVRDALSALRSSMHVNPRQQGPSMCFVGKARLKRKTSRLLLPGNPWREIPSSTLLLDITRLQQGVLLAPATGMLTRASTTARTVCPSYVSLLRGKKTLTVYHMKYVLSKQPASAFGRHSINVFD
ncbi:hypothetical protein cyc_06962 [Cyclospora cayetanensis]|uniref:Uncharacterized protein n=1 Tax=Cyclospora cayetanensis TaxID=88456 RepID=A0A1D3CUF0_9EIME|nr:hypothetical protein cyc_06962 [Cyclospora cayetanensis]